MRRRWFSIGLVLVGLALGLVAGCIVVVGALATGATVAVDNRSSYETEISIGDGEIGCFDSETVVAGASESVKLSLHLDDPLLEVLCIADPIRYFYVSNRSGMWPCDWERLKLDRRVVVTNDGPDCRLSP